jgi:hypothetical protein
MAGVTRSTLARGKKEDEEVELMLDQARFQYQAPRLAKIDETRMKDGQSDWRAQAWLVKFANPEVYGAPSRRRKLRDVELELTPEEKRAQEEAESMAELEQASEDWKMLYKSREAFFESGKKITPAMLALLQQRRAIALRDNEYPDDAEESAPEEADAPVKNARTEERPAGTDAAAARESGAGAPKSVTFRPEIHGLYRDHGAWPTRAAAGAPPPAMSATQRTVATAA